MRIESLRLLAVRNLQPTLLEPSARFNVFSGDNGQGKTNLLEAVFVVATVRSFRTSQLTELIGFGAERASIAARVLGHGLYRIYDLELAPGGKKVRLDGKAVRPLSKYFGDFNVVLFAPEDLQIPRGSPADRRRFLDRAVFNRRTDYLPAVQRYELALKNRNAVLRKAGEGALGGAQLADLLDVYDAQLATLGCEVIASRVGYLDELRPLVQQSFGEITRAGLTADIDYTCGGESAKAHGTPEPARQLELLRASRARDLARQATNVGPHRDDLRFSLEGHDAGSFASQGQLRAIVLAWKTAELELLSAKHQDPPILLLDDVSSELDAQRNRYLFEHLAPRAGQCFITTTHPGHVLITPGERRDYRVVGGAISQAETTG
ncbi:MAG: DNA replication/repair protein RecF [Kofleriaceae bacterium]